MLLSISMINKPHLGRPEQRWKLIHASVMKWSHKSRRELRLTTVFIKIQISLSVLMCCCLSNECNAYDDGNSCLKIEEWSVETHSGHLTGPEMPLLEIGHNCQAAFWGTGSLGTCAHESTGTPICWTILQTQRSVNRFLRLPPARCQRADEECCDSPMKVKQGGARKKRWGKR